jgi:hypothetical protein
MGSRLAPRDEPFLWFSKKTGHITRSVMATPRDTGHITRKRDGYTSRRIDGSSTGRIIPFSVTIA